MPPRKPAKAKSTATSTTQPRDTVPKETETRNLTKQEPVPEEPKHSANESKNGVESTGENQANEGQESPSKKRKQTAEPDQPQKTPRRSARGAPKSQPTQQQLLRYMLSKDAEDLCRPQDETEDIRSRGNIRTYSSAVLSPFEELLCAVILSRPISHRLGLRSIRTVLNEPYNFTTPKAIQAAGAEKRHQALWDAKTQHKGKTADQMGQIADVVLEKFTSADDKDGSRLQKALQDGNSDIDQTLALLKENIKGLGKTGLDIFLRRVQWLWPTAYPFVDDRTSKSLKQLGLPQDGESVEKLIDENWSKLDSKHLAGDDVHAKKRRAFVIVLERATGAELEGKVDALAEAAATAATS